MPSKYLWIIVRLKLTWLPYLGKTETKCSSNKISNFLFFLLLRWQSALTLRWKLQALIETVLALLHHYCYHMQIYWQGFKLHIPAMITILSQCRTVIATFGFTICIRSQKELRPLGKATSAEWTPMYTQHSPRTRVSSHIVIPTTSLHTCCYAIDQRKCHTSCVHRERARDPHGWSGRSGTSKPIS